MDRAQAYREAHKGAIMLHQGETYVVNETDLETHTVRVTETDVDYYTQPLREVDLRVIETLETRHVQDTKCAFGDVEVTEQYTGYKIKKGDTIIGVEPLSLPPLTFRTKAFWLVLSDPVATAVSAAGLDLAGGLHGAEHARLRGPSGADRAVAPASGRRHWRRGGVPGYLSAVGQEAERRAGEP